MRLQQILDLAQQSELKQIIIGEDYAQTLALLNLALIDVYGQFNVLEEEQLITLEENKSRYALDDNNVRVTMVYRKLNPDDDTATSIPINDINNSDSVFTPTPYILHVPNPVQGEIISVIYSVAPPYITEENILSIDFHVPPQFLEPILSYIGYLAYKSMNGDQQTENAARYQNYLRSSDDVRKRGHLNYSIQTNTKTKERGYM